MPTEDRCDINECKMTLKDNAQRWLEDGVPTVTIVSAFAETMAEVGVALVGPQPTSALLQYIDQKIQACG